MTEKNATNIIEYSVSEVSGAVKRTVEEAFGYVRVRGEISGFRGQHGSGHAYFAMKDEKARLEAVIWKGVYNRLKIKPEEGLEVIATGKITTYPGSSKYQIVIEALEPAGAGALMALLEERKRKLQAEGLFDPARKQRLPYLPRVIGVVTSPTGAVIRDIMHRFDDRFPTHVVVWPVRVQGETSGMEVARAVEGFNQIGDGVSFKRPDLIIVARGGGSLEDLWGFNDEAVVRSVASSDIPVISAVGHETDWTLIDYAADMRAPTPTGAAEMAVPVRADLMAALDDLNRRNRGAILRLLEHRKTHIAGLARALPGLDALIALPRQRLDSTASRLPNAIANLYRGRKAAFDALSARISADRLSATATLFRERLRGISERLTQGLKNRVEQDRNGLATWTMRLTPRVVQKQIDDHKIRLENLWPRADRASSTLMQRRRAEWQRLASVLALVSYQSVLDRGFALVRDHQNKPVRSAQAIKAGGGYTVEFSDGRASVTGVGGKPPTSKKSKTQPTKDVERAQGDLF